MTFFRHVVTLSIAVMAVFALAVTAGAETLSVCASGCPYRSIQSAVAAANTFGADTISVAPGEYVGPVQINKTVDVVGAGVGATVIHGGVIVGGMDLTVRLDRLTLSGGLNGLAAVGKSHVIVRDVSIQGNTSDGVLGADLAVIELYNVVVADNGIVVAGNPIGSGILATGQSAIVTSIVTVSGNANSGVVSLDRADLSLGSLTDVVDNGMREGIQTALVTGGVVVGGNSTALIDGIVVSGNGAAGIAVRAEGAAAIVNTMVSDNLGDGIQVGGTLLSEFDTPRTATATIQNTRIADNAGYGILIGELSENQEIAAVTASNNGIMGNGLCGVGIDVQNADAKVTNNFFQNNAENVCQL